MAEPTTEIITENIDSYKTGTTTKTTTPLADQQAKQTDREALDPFVECFFDVEVKYKNVNKARAYFRAISGGEMSITLIEHNVVYQNGGSTTLFIPGASSFAPLTLQQGVTKDMAFWKWWTDVTLGKKSRCEVAITAYGPITADGGDPAQATWTLSNVWPLAISGFNFDLDSGDAFIAEITLVAESITRES